MSRTDESRPDILIIVSDQHNASITGCYGDPLVKTPNIDRLAAEGVLFERAYCPYPVCGPSRMSFTTGRYPYDIECWNNGSSLASDIPTFAHALGIAGYEVVLDGRAHFTGPDQRHGFQRRLVGDICESYPGPMHDSWVRVGDKTYRTGIEGFFRPSITAFSGPGGSVNQEFDKAVTQAALKFISDRSEQRDRRPFCLLVGYQSPHYWFTCPPEDFELYEGKVSAPPLPDDHPECLHSFHRRIIANADLEAIPVEHVLRTRAAYYGLVTFTDRMAGKLLDALEQGGLREDTLVLYFTDHGEMAGEHGLWWKNSFYEGASRVPLIVSWPGRLPAGKRGKELVSLIDLFPSVCDWTGAPRPPELTGRSLGPLIRGGEWDWERAVFCELYDGFPGVRLAARMARKGPWKYNYYHGQPAELFNLEEDPAEFHNLVDDPAHQSISKELETLVLQGWDPQEASVKSREDRSRREYLVRWAKAVNPPDPNQWEGRKGPFPDEWKENALAFPEYAKWVEEN